MKRDKYIMSYEQEPKMNFPQWSIYNEDEINALIKSYYLLKKI